MNETKMIWEYDGITVFHGMVQHSMKKSVDCELCKKILNDFLTAKENGKLEEILKTDHAPKK